MFVKPLKFGWWKVLYASHWNCRFFPSLMVVSFRRAKSKSWTPSSRMALLPLFPKSPNGGWVSGKLSELSPAQPQRHNTG